VRSFAECDDREGARTTRDGSDWWDELDGELLTWLERTGAATPYELGQHLGLPEAATASLLAMLVQEGKVRMCLVQRAADVGAERAT
jgi:hypothetical protein